MVFTDSPIDGTHIFRRLNFMVENFVERDWYLDCVKCIEMKCKFVVEENIATYGECISLVDRFIEADEHKIAHDTLTNTYKQHK